MADPAMLARALRLSCESRMKGYETPIHAADVIRVLDLYEAGLTQIAKGETPPEPHGHFTAHRAAVQIARGFLRQEPTQ